MKFRVGILALLLPISALALEREEEGEKLFALKVNALLESKCIACHSAKEGKIKGDLDLSTREGMLLGGETSEEVLVPGHPEKSLIMTAIEWKDEDYEMPPKENDRLTEKQIDWIRQWIKLGAPWPDQKTRQKYLIEERAKPVTEEGILVQTSGGLSDDWTYRRYLPEDLWAFQPLTKPKTPIAGLNPVDSFVRAKLNQEKVKPAPPSHFRNLVKRAYLDLHGLPPTPYEIYQFRLAWDKNPQKAWVDLIDQLLESPHYGERSAQHWLDVARYADTAGLSNDYERSNMWRYRDYVTRSFNHDKPYDQFVIEQIAGDELGRTTQGQKGLATSGGKLVPSHGTMGPRHGFETPSPSIVPRRRGQLGRANFPQYDHALLQVP